MPPRAGISIRHSYNAACRVYDDHEVVRKRSVYWHMEVGMGNARPNPFAT